MGQLIHLALVLLNYLTSSNWAFSTWFKIDLRIISTEF